MTNEASVIVNLVYILTKSFSAKSNDIYNDSNDQISFDVVNKAVD